MIKKGTVGRVKKANREKRKKEFGSDSRLNKTRRFAPGNGVMNIKDEVRYGVEKVL